MKKLWILPLAGAVLTSVLVLAGPAHGLSCAPPPPGQLSFKEMIDQETTAKAAYPVMFLGVVSSWKDLGGPPGGGKALARLAVAAHPAGWAPLMSEVHFVRQYPGVVASWEFEYKINARYVVLGRRMNNGTFRFDGPCGQSKRLNHDRFRELVRYARQH